MEPHLVLYNHVKYIMELLCLLDPKEALILHLIFFIFCDFSNQ